MHRLPTLALLAGAAALAACTEPPADRAASPSPPAVAAALPDAPRANGAGKANGAGERPAEPEPAGGPSAPAERAYSAQLHVHGSFSEGIGSIDSHSFEASDLDLDVLWWSDHDFRITSYGHVASFGFEDRTEPLPATSRPAAGLGGRRNRKSAWVKELLPIRGKTAGRDGSTSFVAGDAREGQKSLRLEMQAPAEAEDFAIHGFVLSADRGLFKRPLASDVRLLLSVLPERFGTDARAFVDVTMSEHAPHEGLPMEPYHVRYLLGPEGGEPERTGTTFLVPVALRPGEWNDLALPVSRDAVRGFPFIHGEDNSLALVAIGVETRRGGAAAVRFDDFRIEQELGGGAAFARQKRLIDAVARDYPKLEQLQGIEISWIASHLNEFSVATVPIDYDRLLADVGSAKAGGEVAGRTLRDRLARRIVDEVHARGGLVSYNHMYGAMMVGAEPRFSREQVLERLVESGAYGADILEVGYRERGGRSLEDHLWVWDRLAEHGTFPVGTGVSDSHGGPAQRWRTNPNNFVSWIYARSRDKADLIAGMRAGRVFFGDLVLFDGTLDLTTPRGRRMGEIVLSDRDRAVVTVRADGVAAGDTLRVMVSGREAASHPVTGTVLEQREEIELDPRLPTTVRVEIHAPDGTAKVLSNPIVFVRAAPAGGLSGPRAALDVGGLASRRIEGFAVTAARAGGGGAIEIAGRGDGGRLELDLSGVAGTPQVELQGLEGEAAGEPSALVVTGLRGEGTIVVRGVEPRRAAPPGPQPGDGGGSAK